MTDLNRFGRREADAMSAPFPWPEVKANDKARPSGRILRIASPAVATGTRSISQSQRGRYELYAEIGSGGMATIHLGKLVGMAGFARTVAIKRLHPQFAKDPQFVASLLDEARLAARIRHPNVVSTLDVVVTEGELFVIMEYVLGESLAEIMRLASSRGERIPVSIAATIMVGVLHGLQAAHEARDDRGEPLRIVHRDISPHNILVGTDGAAHVIDFGIAKARGRAQVTRDGQIKGKLSYMPPEQLLDGAVDHRADVFAASIVFWEALTGRRLFQGMDDGDVLARVLHGRIEPPSVHVPSVSPAVDAVVLRGLARDRAKRYATARDMALAIEAAASLAPSSRVGSWVEALAGGTLRRRAAQMADIEREAYRIDGRETPFPTAPSVGSRVDRESSHIPCVPSVPSGGRSRGPIADARSSAIDRLEPTVPTLSIPVASLSASTLKELDGDRRSATFSRTARRTLRRTVLALTIAVLSVMAAVGAMRFRARYVRISDVIVAGPSPAEAPLEIFAPPPVSAHALAPQPPAADSEPPRAPKHRTMKLPAGSPSSVARSGGSIGSQTSVRPLSGPDAAPATRPASTVGPSHSSCDPPFWYDADGNKRYLRHCADL